MIEESLPHAHIPKNKRTDIVDYFKELYQAYWANIQGELTVSLAMDAANLTLTILHYIQHLAGIAAKAQKTSDDNAWVILQVKAKLKTRTKKVAALKALLAKKSPTSEETLSPQLERALQEADAAWIQLVHVKAEARDLRAAREELQSTLRRLADSEAKIT